MSGSITPRDAARAAVTCHAFLRPGGHVRAAVPDGWHPDPRYVAAVRPGGTGAGAHDHQVLYTHESFRQLFEGAGFEVRLLEYFDEHGGFHGIEWDPADGFVSRSRRFDPKNVDGRLAYTSIILDAIKPDAALPAS